MRVFALNILLTLCCLAISTKASKILFLVPFASKSQRNTFDPLIEELARRNHEITQITNLESTKKFPNLRNIFLEGGNKMLNMVTNTSQAFTMSASTGNAIIALSKMICASIDDVYGDPIMQQFIKDPGHYDVIVVNVWSEPYLHIAHKIGAPVIILSPPALFPHVAWDLNIPNPLSYIPLLTSPYKPEMSFMQRVYNFIMTASWLAYRPILSAQMDSIVSKYIPVTVSNVELARNVSLILLNTHFSLEQPRPAMPYMIEVGGMHCRKGEKLPEEFESFVNSSGEHGFIVFSMGSMLQGQHLPEHVVEAFRSAFSKVQQKVIWKYEKPLAGLTDNVMLSKWIPQQDLIAHPKCRLAILHGGIASLQEVAYHGVPLLGVPIGMDRDGNINLAIDKGFAELIDWKTVTAEILFDKMKALLEDKKYKENALKVSSLIKDRPQTPLQTATYWVEYVIRHKGAKHLKSAAENLNFFQYFLLDVIGTALLVVTIALLTIVFVAKKLLKLCFPKPKITKKVKVKKN